MLGAQTDELGALAVNWVTGSLGQWVSMDRVLMTTAAWLVNQGGAGDAGILLRRC